MVPDFQIFETWNHWLQLFSDRDLLAGDTASQNASNDLYEYAFNRIKHAKKPILRNNTQIFRGKLFFRDPYVWIMTFDHFSKKIKI